MEDYFVLFREACGDLAWYERLVVITALGAAETFAPLLGGHRIEGFSAMLPGRNLPNRAYLLELGGGGYASWLERLASPVGVRTLSSAEKVASVRELLSAVAGKASAEALRRTTAGGYYADTLGEPGPGSLSAWLADAFDAVTFPAGHEVGRTILTRYYLDRAGPHEHLAEELGLSRRNYFRYHREALERIGDWLFPSS